jgi:hypothetical protein
MFKFALSMFLIAAGASAQTVHTFGMVGVAEGQIARVNVLNPGEAPPAAVGVVCAAQLTFIDGAGVVLKTSSVSVSPGRESYLDLFADIDLALPVNQRRQIRATITIPPVVVPPPSTTPVAPACTLIGTLEIFDAISGKTEVVLGGEHLVPSVTVTSTPAT